MTDTRSSIYSHDHVLFDLDGTLVDTRQSVLECYRRVFREKLGRDFPPASISPHDLFAMRPHEIFSIVAPERAAELYGAYHDTYPGCTAFIKVFAGAKAMIAGLVADRRKPSLVTNKGLERTLIDLGVAGIDPESFAAIVTAEDTVERKPHPAPVLLGMGRAGAAPEHSIYVGDGPQDIVAARAAGIGCIAVTYGFYGRAALIAHEPAAIVESMTELMTLLGLHVHAESRL